MPCEDALIMELEVEPAPAEDAEYIGMLWLDEVAIVEEEPP